MRRLDLGIFQAVAKAQICGRIVNRIAAHDDEQIHIAGSHVGDQVAERFRLVDRVRVHRVGVDDRFADIT